MAKKKVSHVHQEKSSKKQEDSVKADRNITPSMDSEALEKLENLKSLNQMLLKEAMERRQQVESLVHSKGFLESELTRSNTEREALRSELIRLGERAASLELERSVVDVFVAVQVGLKGEEFERKMKGLEMEMRELKREFDEKESEIWRLNCKLSEIEDALVNEREVTRRLCIERDDFVVKHNRKIDDSKGLKEKLIECEEIKSTIEREIDDLRAAYNTVVVEKEDMEMRMKSVTKEKDSIESRLLESNKLIERMKEELRGIVKEKEDFEEEKNMETIKRQELENATSELNEIVSGLQKEEAKLHTIVADFEKKFVESEERQKDMGREIDEMVEGKKLSEKRIHCLVDEKTSIEKDMSEALKKLAEQKGTIDEMVNEKNVIIEAKGRVDNEVGELQNEVAELKTVVLKLEESIRVDLEKIKSLESEVGEYKCKLKQVIFERGRTEHCLNEEKENVARLKKKIGELESKTEESYKIVGEVKAEKAKILDEKIELESRYEMLKKEIASLQNTIIEGQNELKCMKGKVELADANTELVLNMLKGTAAFCSKDECNGEDGEFLGDGGEEMKKHAMELEMIKNAFKNKVGKVEEMKRQLEYFRISAEDAHKKKSFWTALSSATTLLAAVSVAYVARGH